MHKSQVFVGKSVKIKAIFLNNRPITSPEWSKVLWICWQDSTGLITITVKWIQANVFFLTKVVVYLVCLKIEKLGFVGVAIRKDS